MEEQGLTSVQFYNSLAEVYDAELESRPDWVGRVEQLIASWARERGAKTILDIGAGNGRRVWRLARTTGMQAVAVDISPGMIEHARRLGLESHVVDMTSSDFAAAALAGRKFDMVICTWNVMGHVEGHAAREKAVRNMRAVLADGGAVVLDVNNRHNAAQYGWNAALRNFCLDIVRPGTAGDFMAQRPSPNGKTMKTRVHVFSPAEVRALCSQAGLHVKRMEFLDYMSGKPASRWSGQICSLIEAVR